MVVLMLTIAGAVAVAVEPVAAVVVDEDGVGLTDEETTELIPVLPEDEDEEPQVVLVTTVKGVESDETLITPIVGLCISVDDVAVVAAVKGDVRFELSGKGGFKIRPLASIAASTGVDVDIAGVGILSVDVGNDVNCPPGLGATPIFLCCCCCCCVAVVGVTTRVFIMVVPIKISFFFLSLSSLSLFFLSSISLIKALKTSPSS